MSDEATSQMSSELSEPARLAAGDRQHATVDGRAAPLRIGVMLDGWTDRAWVGRILQEIQQSDSARVVTVILNRSKPIPRWRRLWQLLPVALYLIYYRLDRWLMRRLTKPRQDAFVPVDLRPLVGNAAVLEVVPERGKYSDRFDPATVEQVRQQQLDVMLRFGFRIIRGPILEAARAGVWSFHHGDNREYRGGPAMFWEMYDGNPVCGVTLQILTDVLDGGKVIYRTMERTNQFSLYLNQNRCYWKATESVALRLRQLHAHGWNALCELDTYRDQIEYAKPIYRLPRNRAMLRFLARLAGRVVRRAALSLCTEEQWFVAWRRRPALPEVQSPRSGPAYRVFQPPRGHSYADPFLVERDGRHYLFFEHYPHATYHGVISWIEIDAQGNPSSPAVALSTDYHLSYPCVFEHDGQMYMIPETRTRRRIELWRADRFPDRWTFERVLIDNVSAVDATWLHYLDRYWLFAGLRQDGSASSDELHIYSSGGPFGPWRPHRANPVVTTVRGARPAGRPFLAGGHLIRPGQDCAAVYGHLVRLYRVDRLSDAEYRETEVAQITPDWLPGNVGTHTYNSDTAFEVIDGRVRVWRGMRRRKTGESEP
jgi:hypothetical protein